MIQCYDGNILVNVNKMIQYTTRTGQKTGTLNAENHVHTKAIRIALVALTQNLNSGNRLTNGRNSSSCLTGKGDFKSPSSNASSSEKAGSNFGVKKARKRLRR